MFSPEKQNTSLEEIVDVYLLHLKLLHNEERENRDILSKMAREFCSLFDDEVDRYWCFFNFLQRNQSLENRMGDIIETLKIDTELREEKIMDNPRLSKCISGYLFLSDINY